MGATRYLFLLLLLIPLALAADFTINTTTTGWDLGTKLNTSTTTNEYNHTTNALELSFPYALKDANLVAYWRFEVDESPQTDECSTLTLNESTLNPPTAPDFTSACKFGGCYNYTKANRDAMIMSGEPMNTDTGTVSVWVKRKNAANTEYHTMFGMGCSGNTHLFRFLTIGDGVSKWGIHYDTRGATYKSMTTTLTMDTNVWYHIVVTTDGTTGRLYVNGADRSVGNDPDWFSDFSPSGTIYSSIGAWVYNTGWIEAEYGDEWVDEVKLYNDSLSTAEILALYNSGNQYVASGNWTSATQAMTSGSNLLNTTITYSGVNATANISKIEWLVGGVVKATYATAITSGTSITIVNANLTSGTFSNVSADFTIMVYLASNGAGSPTITSISGDYAPNTPPTTSNTTIIPAIAYSNSTVPPYPYSYNQTQLNCSAVCTDTESNTLYANFTWFKNGAAIHTYDTQVSCTNATVCYTNLNASEQLVVGDNWTASARCYDEMNYSAAWVNSTNRTILEWATPTPAPSGGGIPCGPITPPGVSYGGSGGGGGSGWIYGWIIPAEIIMFLILVGILLFNQRKSKR